MTDSRPPFRGPFADGPPPEALEVEIADLDHFGLGELRRAVVVQTVLFVCVLKALVRGLPRIVRQHKASVVAEAAAEGAIDAFILLGPTFVKTGQVIASSTGLFPATLSNAARRCLDAVPPFPVEEVHRVLESDLGQPVATLFESFDDTPLSAASIGQVHACTLPGGRAAVVKIQRPNIRHRMLVDLRILLRLARLLHRTPWGRTFNAEAAVRDLHATSSQELNPALEAWRQDRFRANIGAFGDNTMVTAPEVLWNWCGPQVICMERVWGIPMDHFEEIERRGLDGALILRRGAKVWAEAALVHGPFHGDMHAGNIWVLEDGRGCYLDFGIMGELDDEWRNVLRDLFYTAAFDLDFTRVVRAYRRVGIFPEGVGTDEEIAERLGAVMGPVLASGMKDFNISEMVAQSVDMLSAFGGVAPQELMLISKQMLYIERYTTALAPDYVLTTDPFIMKNIFPEEAKAKAAELGVTFPE
ncbi:MAG TPA: AarF/UbiB family protein [Acidimicrobiales bacterium]|jgi:predicted unusual protein kinase regulating ubiquinone biosynthesis (AarF/ABC1/UbiB family)|nr:AarF/UbiB family protein [Acidimicrobiales bacterium]